MPRILVVDDEPNIARLMQVNLERQGYQVETANNGIQALEKLRASRPDLMVTDVMMPEMDGLELVSKIRRDPSLADLPVILSFAIPNKVHPASFTPYTDDPCLIRPFNPQELVEIVKRVLAKSSEDRSP